MSRIETVLLRAIGKPVRRKEDLRENRATQLGRFFDHDNPNIAFRRQHFERSAEEREKLRIVGTLELALLAEGNVFLRPGVEIDRRRRLQHVGDDPERHFARIGERLQTGDRHDYSCAGETFGPPSSSCSLLTGCSSANPARAAFA